MTSFSPDPAQHPQSAARVPTPPVLPGEVMPPGRDSPDPGTPSRARWAMILTLGVVGIIMILQQMGAHGSGAPAAQGPIPVEAPVGPDPVSAQLRMYVQLAGVSESMQAGSGAQIVGNLQRVATTDVERVRAIMTYAFLLGPDKGPGQGLDRLEDLALGRDVMSAAPRPSTAPPDFEGWGEDLATLRSVWGTGATLSQEQTQRLIARHGYFARLALASGDPLGAPSRAALQEGGWGLIVFISLLVLLGLLVFVAAVTCFAIAMARFQSGKMRPAFRAPLAGGSVFLEAVVALALGFLALKGGMGVIAGLVTPAGGTPPAWLTPAAMALQWSLIACCFYPLLRGVPWAEFTRRVGWHKGKGVLREAGAGLFLYFATLPLVFVALGVVIVIVLVQGIIAKARGELPTTQENPIVDIIASGQVWQLLLLYALATLWAPFVEETIFRGCLFRHFRTRFRLIASAIFSAVLFGVMHGYPILLLGPVITLGFNFALMREWRDSLIAPMFAHALHNGTVLLVALGAVSVLSMPS